MQVKTLAESRALAESLVKTAALNGLTTSALITRMDEPLGCAAGNWLETKEAIDCLKGYGPADLMDVTFRLSTEMLLMAKKASSQDEAYELLQDLIDSGTAFAKFCEIVEYQNGDVTIVNHPENYPESRCQQSVHSPRSGHVAEIDALAVGLAVVQLGGGRQVIEVSWPRDY